MLPGINIPGNLNAASGVTGADTFASTYGDIGSINFAPKKAAGNTPTTWIPFALVGALVLIVALFARRA